MLGGVFSAFSCYLRRSDNLFHANMSDTSSEVSTVVILSGETRLCTKCSKRMPVPDLHTVCDLCRGTICAMTERCEICSQWSDNYMSKYLRHMNMLIKTRERKRRARGRPSEAAASSAPPPEEFCGFCVTTTASSAPVTTVASSAPTTTLVTTSASASPIVHSAVVQGSTEPSVVDDLGPDDSVSNTSSRVARAIDQGLREFSKAQEGRE